MKQVNRHRFAWLMMVVGMVGGLLGWGVPALGKSKLPLDMVNLPSGFEIQVYAHNVRDARFMAQSPKGTLFVGTKKAGKVYAIVDRDQDHKADAVLTLASGLWIPNGVAYHRGSLYVAEAHRILRFDDIDAHLEAPPQPVVVQDNLPEHPKHGSRLIGFGPDGLLYIAVGAPCDACIRDDKRYATILRKRLDQDHLEPFALGVRDALGFDWHPQTSELWFTDNGRNYMGADLPPDELNRASQAGLHFGFPYCHGRDVPDPHFGQQLPCEKFTPPALDLPAHVAPIGMRFYTGTMFPEPYHQRILIAEHGSWNRRQPVGYRITQVQLSDRGTASYNVFADGWLTKQGRPWGRPVDVLVASDGALLVSDDHAHVIYRISYNVGVAQKR